MAPTSTLPGPAAVAGTALRRLLDSPLTRALTFPHGVDRYLELLRPAATMGEARAEVTAVRRTTADTVTLDLRPNAAWRGFRAGQYVRVGVEIDGVVRTRCYSPANSQHERGRVELTVKACAGGVVSPWLVEHAAPGLVLRLSEAAGDFTLPEPRPGRLLLVSGGSGITPVLAMARTLADEGHTGEVTFLHYAFRPADVPCAEDLRALRRRLPGLRLVLGCTEDPGGDLQGFFGRHHLEAAGLDHGACETYLCGPPGLMTSVRELWETDGLAGRLHVEDFAPLDPGALQGEAGGTIRFARSGTTVDNDGRSLLEQAEAAGLRPEFGCRMGICLSCTRVKEAGCVRNARSGALSTPDEEEIQLCISVPAGDVTVDL